MLLFSFLAAFSKYGLNDMHIVFSFFGFSCITKLVDQKLFLAYMLRTSIFAILYILIFWLSGKDYTGKDLCEILLELDDQNGSLYPTDNTEGIFSCANGSERDEHGDDDNECKYKHICQILRY